MSRLWANARDVLSQKADPALRRTRFAQLFHEDFDGPGMARFVVGRYWRTASQEEQQEFVGLFEDYVVFVYTARLGDFGGERFNIRSSRSDGDGVIVSTAIFGLDNTSPLNVDWRLVSDNGAYKINIGPPAAFVLREIIRGKPSATDSSNVLQALGGVSGLPSGPSRSISTCWRRILSCTVST
jgi:phospholipid transport system substrate-binding protein